VSTPALAAAEAVGLAHRVIRHGPVRSLAEAAQARGVAPADVVKTLVVRRGEDDFLFVLVPGDRVIRHGPVRSLAEAAQARGVAPADVVKTLVVRRGEDDFLFVLVPGDRVISWPKLRALLGVSRLSMPDAEAARQATGYERGTITPLGSIKRWPVIADERMRGHEITLGAGEHGLALAVDADEILQALNASVADISDPVPAT
jgi:Cys-tRNA(Pro)/Cys-tRNA(Cys) deacylase